MNAFVICTGITLDEVNLYHHQPGTIAPVTELSTLWCSASTLSHTYSVKGCTFAYSLRGDS